MLQVLGSKAIKRTRNVPTLANTCEVLGVVVVTPGDPSPKSQS